MTDAVLIDEPTSRSAPTPPRSRGRAVGALAWLAAWLVVFSLLALWHRNVITLPAYCDFAIGLFVEADWLLEHDFDYQRLRYDELSGNEGGPRIYMTSVLPTLLALLMSTGLSTTGVMVVCHLVTFALAAMLLVALFALLRPVVGPWGAGLACLATATTPLFSVQVEMIGLDLPMAAFATVAALAALRHRFGLAALAAAASFAMKNTGLVPTAALVGYFALVVLSGWATTRLGRGRLWGGGVVLLTVFAAQIAVFRWSSIGNRLTDAESMPFELVSFRGVTSICPDLVLLFFICGAWALVRLLRGAWQARALETMTTLRPLIATQGVAIVAWSIVIGMTLAVALFVQFPVPRYFTAGVPFLYAAAAIVLFAGRPTAKWAMALAVGWIALNLANSHGRFFPHPGTWARNGPALERSHEYLPDHLAIIEAMHAVEGAADGAAIVAGHPFAFYLALPRLGYVERSLSGYVMNPYTGPHFVGVERLLVDRPRKLLLVHADNLFYGLSKITIGPPGDGDHVLYDDQAASPLTVYTRDVPAEATSDTDMDHWLLETFWYDPTLAERPSIGLVARAAELQKAGLGQRSLELLRMGVTREPEQIDYRLELARRLIGQGQAIEAHAHALEAEWRAPHSVAALDVLGQALMAQGKLAGARSELEHAIELDPTCIPARIHLSQLFQRQGSLRQAEATAREALALEPDNAKTRYQLCQVLVAAGQTAAARDELEQLVTAAHDIAAAWLQLAELYVRDRQPARAIETLERAVAALPNEPALREALGRALANGGRWEQAQVQLEHAVRLAPEWPEARNTLAVVLMQLRRFAEAREMLVVALRLKPDFAAAEQNLRRAEAALRQGGAG